jgi:hypothetical protein
MGAYGLGGLKKDIKSALKSTDVARIQSALTREQAKLDKSPSSKKAAKRVAYVQQLTARLTSAQASTPVLPGAPEQPIPSLPSPSDAFSFSQGGGGNSGTSFATPEPTAAAGEADDGGGLSLPVMIGLGAGALLVLYLLTRRH